MSIAAPLAAAPDALATATTDIPASAPATLPAAAPSAPPEHVAAPATFDPLAFVREHRIHVKNGSLFVAPNLVVHRAELHPANEAALRHKLDAAASLNSPSFSENASTLFTVLHLGQLVPVSLTARHSQLIKAVTDYNDQVKTNVDKQTLQPLADKHAPVQALVRETLKKPELDPVGTDVMKHGLTLYYLLRQKLQQSGFSEPLESYIGRANSTDQLLATLQPMLGVTPLELQEAAAKSGMEGVGRLLKLEPHFVQQTQAMVEAAQGHDFSANFMEHWFLGQRKLGCHTPMPQLLEAGKKERIEKAITDLRAKIQGPFESPEPIKQTELQVAEALKLASPLQLKLMHALGYEICYTPEMYADSIAFARNVFGLHRKLTNRPTDLNGVYRIYYAARGNQEDSMSTLVHEIAHVFFPDQLSPAQITAMDQLITRHTAHIETLSAFLNDTRKNPQGMTPFEQLEALHGAYVAGNAEQKAAVIQAANTLFAPVGIKVDGLFPQLRDPNRLKTMVSRTLNDLRIEGGTYQRGAYDMITDRLREMISRFAELKQVRLRGEPELLNFIAPDMNTLFDQYYLPHLESVYSKLLQQRSAVVANDNARHGLRKDAAATSETAALLPQDATAPPAPSPAPAAAAPAATGQQLPAPIDAGVVATPPPAGKKPEPTAPTTPQPAAAATTPIMEVTAEVQPPAVPETPAPPTITKAAADHAQGCSGCPSCGTPSTEVRDAVGMSLVEAAAVAAQR